MALDDIKKEILAEAEKEAKKIGQEGEDRINTVRDEWARKVEVKKQEIIATAQRKTDQKIQQSQFKVQSQSQTEILNQKQTVIDKVYKLALQKLTEIDDDKYIDLMKKLINQLPDGEGELTSVKDKDNLLKKALRKSGKKYDLARDAINGSGGFIFRSKKVEIDNTFATLVNNAKEQTILEISGLLFNQSEIN